MKKIIKKTLGTILCTPFYLYFKFYENYYLRKAFFLKKTKGTRYLDVKLKNFNKNIFIDLEDEGITREVLTINLKEPLNVKIITKILKKNKIKTIIDLGANIGDFVLMEKDASPDSRMIAIEPVSKNYKLLKLNIERNDLENTQYEQVAVGDKNSKTKIYIPKQGNWSSLYKSKFTEKSETEIVTLKTLSTIFKEYNIPLESVFIRTDIEGYEYNLIKYNKEFLKNLSDSWFSLEFHNQILTIDECVEFMNFMKEIGYEIKYINNEGPLWASFYINSNLFPIIKYFYKMKVDSEYVYKIRKNIKYDTVIEELKNQKYPYGPHIQFYKK